MVKATTRGGAPITAPIYEAYCVKCRTKREIKDPIRITMKNGRPAVQGTCPHCGTNVDSLVKTRFEEVPAI